MLALAQRLRKNRDFERLYRKGGFRRTDHFVIRYQANPRQTSRFGVVVAKKVIKKAVGRNRAKRRITELLRIMQPAIKDGYDCVLIVKQDIAALQPGKLQGELQQLLSKAGIVQ